MEAAGPGHLVPHGVSPHRQHRLHPALRRSRGHPPICPLQPDLSFCVHMHVQQQEKKTAHDVGGRAVCCLWYLCILPIARCSGMLSICRCSVFILTSRSEFVQGGGQSGVGAQVVQGDQSGKEAPLATPAADVWALGVIAYEVLCGTHLQAVCQCCTCSVQSQGTIMPFEGWIL